MREFEKSLQKADMELGRDGNISLPYWNWSDPNEIDKGLPNIIRKRQREFPKDLFPENMNPRPMDLSRAGDRQISRLIRSPPLFHTFVFRKK